MTVPRLAAALWVLLIALPAAAQTATPTAEPQRPAAAGAPAQLASRPAPLGLSVFTDIGGGGAIGGNRGDASSGGIVEAEVGAGFELPQGFRPEVALLVGVAPRGLVGFRPGLRWSMETMPFFFRGAFDVAAPGGSWRIRWVMGGGGAEVRFTDSLGGFVEADLGIPIATKAGFAILLRAGVNVRI